MSKQRTTSSPQQINTLIRQRRSIRRFQQETIEENILKTMVDAARLAPSAANKQPLRFIIVNKRSLLDKIFPTIKWAAYIKPEWQPNPNEHPVAYIVILSNTTQAISSMIGIDIGLAVENLVLTAESFGVGSCLIGSFNKKIIRDLFSIPKNYSVDLLIALGYKKEQPVLEDRRSEVKYWRDEQHIHHVPKQSLSTFCFWNDFSEEK